MAYKQVQYHDDWIIENISKFSRFTEFLQAYNVEFNDNIAYATLHRHIVRTLKLDINFDRSFSEEQIQWLKDNYGCTYKELTDRFNERFGTNYTWSRDKYSPIERLCKRMGFALRGIS